MDNKPHIVSVFDKELEKLKQTVAKMVDMARDQISDALKALVQQDEILAQRTVKRDHEVNALQSTVDGSTLRLLAIRQPLAVDLRQILAASRMASDLERIADYAAAIAKRANVTGGPEIDEMKTAIADMAEIAQGMLKDVGKAYLDTDVTMAKAVWDRDDEIDHVYSTSLRSLGEKMTEELECGEPCIVLLNAARAMERIGDHITNLAEHVAFVVTGTAHFKEK
jgi:phosphate transport system protein